MFDVVFYRDICGCSDVESHIEKLRIESKRSKDSRIRYNQIILYVSLLESNGFSLTSNFSKHLFSDIWELRHGNYRILYSFIPSIGFILLTIFRKQTQKTPKSEMEKAIACLKDFRLRMEDNV